MVLGDRLRKLREKRELSQYELARRLGIARTTYQGYEMGAREPDYETLQKIADFFDVSTDYLLGRTNDPSQPDDLDIQINPNDPYWKKAIEIYKELQEGKRPVVHGLDILTILSLPEEEQKKFAKALKRIAESLEKNLDSSESIDQ